VTPSLGLHGSYYSTLDAKGRVSVPARLREILAPADLAAARSSEPGIMLTAGRDDCVLVFPDRAWSELSGQLRAASPFDDEAQRRKRLFFANSQRCTLDKQGRVLVPPPLRDLAQLAKECIWLGVDDHAEVWDVARWEEERRRR
jgi:MraZ protein